MAQMTRAEIMDAQRALNRMGVRGKNGRPLKVDGIVGPNTMFAMQQSASQPQQAAQSAMPPVPRPRPQRMFEDPTLGADVAALQPPAPTGPPGLAALMNMPAMPQGGSFTPSGPPGGMGMGGNMAMGQPPRFGGLPMRDPDSRLNFGDPRYGDIFDARFNAIFGHRGEPQSIPGQERMAQRMAGQPSPFREPLRDLRQAAWPPMVPATAMEPSGVIPGLPTLETRTAAMEGSGVVPGAPRPAPSADRWADAMPPPAPPRTQPFPMSLINDLGIGGLTDTATRVFTGAPPAGATDAPQGGLSIGNVVGGYRYKGGDPNTPASWEKVQ